MIKCRMYHSITIDYKYNNIYNQWYYDRRECALWRENGYIYNEL